MSQVDWDIDEDLSEGHEDEEPAFTCLPDFVDWVASYYRRSGVSWCREWWRHAEAVVAFEALWRAFEELRLVPGTGAAVFLKEYLEPMMRTLTSSGGTFGRCTSDKCKLQEKQKVSEPPEGMFIENNP